MGTKCFKGIYVKRNSYMNKDLLQEIGNDLKGNTREKAFSGAN